MHKYGLQSFQETKSCQPTYAIILTKRFLYVLKLEAAHNIKKRERVVSFYLWCLYQKPSHEIVLTPITFHLGRFVSLSLQMTHLIRTQKGSAPAHIRNGVPSTVTEVSSVTLTPS
jgi:hypothetical protein